MCYVVAKWLRYIRQLLFPMRRCVVYYKNFDGANAGHKSF